MKTLVHDVGGLGCGIFPVQIAHVVFVSLVTGDLRQHHQQVGAAVVNFSFAGAP
jgi:hypothetical protein